MNKDRDSYLSELAELDKTKRKYEATELMFSVSTIVLLLFIVTRAIKLYSDDTLVSYRAPEVTEMGAPIRLVQLEQLSPNELQNMIYDFSRLFIRSLYPKNSKEAKFHYDYIVRHTTNYDLKNEYQSYLDSLDDVGVQLDSGRFKEFFPLNSLDFRVRKIDNEKEWVFEIDGFLNNRISMIEESRGVVTMRLTIEYLRPSSKGSYSGWYVKDLEILTLRDVVANNKENIKE